MCQVCCAWKIEKFHKVGQKIAPIFYVALAKYWIEKKVYAIGFEGVKMWQFNTITHDNDSLRQLNTNHYRRT